MGIILSANTTQFISDLISPSGTTFSAGTTELLSPNGAFTMEDIRSSIDLQDKITSGDIRLFSDIDEVVNNSMIGINDITAYGGIITKPLSVDGGISATTYYGDGSTLTGVSGTTGPQGIQGIQGIQGVSGETIIPDAIEYFNAYDSVGGTSTNLTNTWIDIPLGGEKFTSTDYQHSTVTNNQEVTIQTAGTYLVLGNVSTKNIINNRSQTQSRLVLDDGGGYVFVDGTMGEMYNRQTNYGATSSFVTPLTLGVGDKLKMQFQKTFGAGTITTQADGSSLTIINIVGPKGDKGDIGVTSGSTNDIHEVYVTATTSTVSVIPVDLDSMSLLTSDLGGTGTYTINFTASRANSLNASLNFFYITVDGVRVVQKRIRSFNDEIHTIAGTAVVSGVPNGTTIKIQYDSQGGGTHTVYERTMNINGILDINVV